MSDDAPRNKCRHCGSVYSALWECRETCEHCGCYPVRACMACHLEIVHGIIPPPCSIHFVGNGHEGLTERQAAKLGMSR